MKSRSTERFEPYVYWSTSLLSHPYFRIGSKPAYEYVWENPHHYHRVNNFDQTTLLTTKSFTSLNMSTPESFINIWAKPLPLVGQIATNIYIHNDFR